LTGKVRVAGEPRPPPFGPAPCSDPRHLRRRPPVAVGGRRWRGRIEDALRRPLCPSGFFVPNLIPKRITSEDLLSVSMVTAVLVFTAVSEFHTKAGLERSYE